MKTKEKEEQITFEFPGVARCSVEDQGLWVYIHKLKIEPEFQSKGLGSRVLRELKKKYPKGLRLYCWPDDPDRLADLQRFYQRNGFHYDEGTDFMCWP